MYLFVQTKRCEVFNVNRYVKCCNYKTELFKMYMLYFMSVLKIRVSMKCSL